MKLPPSQVQLTVFSLEDPFSKLKLSGRGKRTGTLLHFEYVLEGEIDLLSVPEPKQNPRRLDHLWEHTCFEAFIAISGKSTYWELNVSPSGDWNLYRFSDYRVGQTKEEKVTQIDFEWKKEENRIVLLVGLDLKGALAEFEPGSLDLGLTAVLETLSQRKSYWAVKHSGSKPDFHLRNSFCISLGKSE
jgi:hypothetical protein